MDIVNELGLEDPDTWDWNDLLQRREDHLREEAGHGRLLAWRSAATCAPTTTSRRCCTRRAGGCSTPPNKFEVVFDSPQTVEALEYVKSLQPYMPKGAVELQLPAGGRRPRHRQDGDERSTGAARYGRAAEETKPVFEANRSLQPRAPSEDRPSQQLERLPGLVHPAAEQPVHRGGQGRRSSTSRPARSGWCRYCHSLDAQRVAGLQGRRRRDPELKEHPFYKTKPRTIDHLLLDSLPQLLEHRPTNCCRGVNPLAGIVHGRSVLAQTVQKVVIDNMEGGRRGQVGRARS